MSLFSFWISGQFPLNSHDIDMKIGPVFKLEKKKTITSKKFYNDVVTANYDVIVNFQIYKQFGAIHEPNSGYMVLNF